MGEWSKRIGEEGEDVVESFLRIIGWDEPQRNFDVRCLKPGEHGKHNDRKTHGIDKYFCYKNPLVNRHVVHAVISVKCSVAPYPAKLEGDFEKYFIDVAQCIDCFHRSETRQKSNRNFQGIDSAEDVGILFWLSLAPTAEWGGSILSKLGRCTPEDGAKYNKIVIVDNYCASFISDTFCSLRAAANGVSPKFFYFNTGRNFTQADRVSSGAILPVEFLTSSVLLLTVDSPGAEKTFVVSTSTDFNADRLRRLLGLAQEITQDLPAKTLILFPDYQRLSHENTVREVKAAFSDRDFVRRVSVASYRSDFRSLSDA